MPTTEELQELHHRALQELNDAEGALASAVNKLKACQRQALLTRLPLVEPQRRAKDLAETAAQNKARWSGGTTNPSNLIEQSMREAALELLTNPPSRIHWS